MASSARSARFAFVAMDYRVLLLFGDNIGDFSDTYSRSVADRAKASSAKAHFGHMTGSCWRSVLRFVGERALRPQLQLSSDEKRAKTIDVLTPGGEAVGRGYCGGSAAKSQPGSAHARCTGARVVRRRR